MRAQSIKGWGEIDAMIDVTEDAPVPKPGKGEVLIKVRAVALAPGDVRFLGGETRLVQRPKRFPYTGGGDVSGEVVQVGKGVTSLHPGDAIYATFVTPKPIGCLAEFAVVKAALAAKKPDALSFEEACTLGSSAATALKIAKVINPGDRVLVLGGTGGVGCFLVQLARDAGASFVAATSSKLELLESLGVDRAINYPTENWWEIPEFQTNRFDVVVDLVCGRHTYAMWRRSVAMKNKREGGRFVTTMGPNPHPQVRNVLDLFKLIGSMVSLQMSAKLHSWSRLVMVNGVPTFKDRGQPFVELNDKIAAGKLRVVLDPAGPFPFTTDGIRSAYALQKSRHAKGKVVVQIS
ncbi:NADPH-dependent alkenal/one oxidoreductase [Durusdinium trenchii]|uniref:Chloroplastic (AtAOR) n=1 Tax=Durusdinium trenchii TaxID=1381693 RepID=A0ABP0RMZ6_9DINO